MAHVIIVREREREKNRKAIPRHANIFTSLPFISKTIFCSQTMKSSVIMFLGVIMVFMAASVSGNPKTYLVETADNGLYTFCLD